MGGGVKAPFDETNANKLVPPGDCSLHKGSSWVMPVMILGESLKRLFVVSLPPDKYHLVLLYWGDGISTADGSRTLQLGSKPSGWIKSTTSRRKNVFFWFYLPNMTTDKSFHDHKAINERMCIFKHRINVQHNRNKALNLQLLWCCNNQQVQFIC